MNTKYYTGIGSRKTPPEVLASMTWLAVQLYDLGYTLRSGHAVGADRAFEYGAEERADVYLPWKDFGVKPYKNDPGCPVMGNPIVVDNLISKNHVELYSQVCFNMQRDPACFSRGIKLLTYRDMHQVVGHEETFKLSDFVVCWTQAPGGTHYAMEAARLHGIPVFNMYDLGKEAAEQILEKVEGR